MNLFLELRINQHCRNLFIIDKLAIIILDKYNQNFFYNIVLVYCNSKNNHKKFYIISYN